jgi:hypothetical protein
MRVLESIRLKVKKPMILQIDNKGAVDIANNWSIGGRTQHIEVRQYFLRDLKIGGHDPNTMVARIRNELGFLHQELGRTIA